MIEVKTVLRVTALFSAFTVRHSSDFYFSGESHDFWELVYVSDGSVGITAGARVLECGAGMTVFHKPGEFHRIWAVGGTTPKFTVISFTATGGYMHRLEEAVIELPPYGQRLMTGLCEQIAAGHPDSGILPALFRTDALITARFANTLESFLIFCLDRERYIQAAPRGDAALFSQAVELMHGSLESALTAAQLARRLHISESHLKRIFARYALTGVHGYYLNLKINRAKELLQSGETVAAAAAATGFCDRNYFSAAFRRETGVSPAQFAKGGEQKKNR